MDYQEALETKIRMCNICREDGKPTEAACNNCSDKLAIYAISKQIPKKPTKKDSSIYYYCPNSECGVIYTGADYCRNCGQRLERIG